ncbi:MAG: TetR/AcrR family transcriptional regulator [Pseudohongiellaceae bacterium]
MVTKKKNETRTVILEAALKVLKENPGKLNISRVAHLAKCSRQAIYLHFSDSTELQVATARYIDEKFELDILVTEVLTAQTPEQLLKNYVDLCAMHNPELYAVIRAADSVRRTDKAVEAAWKDRLAWRRRIGYQIAERLKSWNALAPHWTTRSAGDWLTVQGSIQVWEEIVLDLKYSTSRFTNVMYSALSHALLIRK